MKNVSYKRSVLTMIEIGYKYISLSNFSKIVVHSKFLGSNDNTRQSKILLSIIVMFVFCQCFTIIPDIYELNCFLSTENILPKLFRFYDDDHQCQYYTYHLIEISHLMLAVNSSINFIFYTIHSKLFRENIM